jgi:hypothetical protein
MRDFPFVIMMITAGGQARRGNARNCRRASHSGRGVIRPGAPPGQADCATGML